MKNRNLPPPADRLPQVALCENETLNLDGLVDVNIAARSCDVELSKRLLAFPQVKPTVAWIDECVDAGDLEIVQWAGADLKLDEHKYSVAAMDCAAEKGHLHILQRLHENWSEGCCLAHAMDKVAENGHLDVVQWLHEHRVEGCTANAMDKAAASGHLDVVQWLHDHRSEGCTTYAMDKAASAGHLEAVEWLHENRSEGCMRIGRKGAQQPR